MVLPRFITVYGRVPFLYYVLHFFLIHLVSTIFFFARGHSAAEGIHHGVEIPNFIVPGEGVSLEYIYRIRRLGRKGFMINRSMLYHLTNKIVKHGL